jgi:hypothetical protein
VTSRIEIERRGGYRPGSGRLKTLGAIRKTVSLDEGTIEKGKTIGGGELSRGIRRAVADFPLPDADSGAKENE